MVYRAISRRFPTIVLTSSLLNTFSYKTQRRRRQQLIRKLEREGESKSTTIRKTTTATTESEENKRHHNEMTKMPASSRNFRLFTIALFCTTLFLACEVSSADFDQHLQFPVRPSPCHPLTRICHIYLHLRNVYAMPKAKMMMCYWHVSIEMQIEFHLNRIPILRSVCADQHANNGNN